MSALPYRRRLRTIGAALRRERVLRDQARWSRAELEAHQQARLQDVVRHAVAALPGVPRAVRGRLAVAPVALADLPPVTKGELMERFDDWVTDPRLRGGAVEAHLAALRRRRAARTTSSASWPPAAAPAAAGSSASTRRSGPSSARSCCVAMRAIGITPRLPRRRMATVMAPGPAHMTWRFSASIDVGVHRRLALAATDPLPRLVEALNAFRPDALAAVPLRRRAARRRAARGPARHRAARSSRRRASSARPRRASASASAWGVEAHEVFGATDGLWGSTCEHHRMHFAEDETIVEVEDDRLLDHEPLHADAADHPLRDHRPRPPRPGAVPVRAPVPHRRGDRGAQRRRPAPARRGDDPPDPPARADDEGRRPSASTSSSTGRTACTRSSCRAGRRARPSTRSAPGSRTRSRAAGAVGPAGPRPRPSTRSRARRRPAGKFKLVRSEVAPQRAPVG